MAKLRWRKLQATSLGTTYAASAGGCSARAVKWKSGGATAYVACPAKGRKPAWELAQERYAKTLPQAKAEAEQLVSLREWTRVPRSRRSRRS